jgi:hypothetical protein
MGARAQTPPLPRSGFHVAVGPMLAALRDDAASPLGYGGAGASLELGTGGGALGVDLRGAGARLSSAITDGGRPRETDIRLGLGVTVVRPISPHVRLGGRFDARLSGRFHYYDDPARQDAVFLFGTATLGPIAEWRTVLGAGLVTVSAAFPLGGVALRPWSDARVVGHGGGGPTLVAFPKLLAADARLEWTPSLARPWRVGYRLGVERYHDELRYRSVTQGLYVGFALGGGRP